MSIRKEGRTFTCNCFLFLDVTFQLLSAKSLSSNFSWLRTQKISAEVCKAGILVVTFSFSQM